MTIYLPEVRKISHDFMSLPVFNPNVFSEDEDDLPGMKESKMSSIRRHTKILIYVCSIYFNVCE